MNYVDILQFSSAQVVSGRTVRAHN